METDLMCCYNLKCKRLRIGTTGKFCTACGQGLRSFTAAYSDGHKVGDFDVPPNNFNRKQRKAMRKGRRMENGGIWLPGYSDPEDYMDRRTVGEQAGLVVIDKPNGKGHSTPSAAKDWTCDAGQVNGCPIAVTMDVYIPIAMYDEWTMLADTFDTEWIAYLTGHQSDDGTWIIDSYYFPKQLAHDCHCNVVEGIDGKDECQADVIGTVHSHVKMGAFFSGEDQAHFNHPVELVINARGDIKANVAIKLQCGHPSRSETKVFTLGERPAKEEHPKVAELKSKLTEQKWQSTTSSSSSPNAQNWSAGEVGKTYVRET
jgi:hypothetical protein